MKWLRYVLSALLALGLAAVPALAAGEESAVSEYVQASVFKGGACSGAQSVPGQAQLLTDEQEEQLYKLLLDGLKAKADKIDISAVNLKFLDDREILIKVYEKVTNDHPELYYVTGGFGSSGYSGGIYIEVRPNYDEELLNTDSEAFFEAVDAAMSQVEESMTDLEKALVLHDWLVLRVAYNWDVATTGSTDSHVPYTAYGALVNGDAVCQGYAEAYKLLMDQCGIPCVMVPSDPMNHVWNGVQIDGAWYHVDTTWDDPTPNMEGYCSHENFLRSDTGIASTKHKEWETPEGITFSNTDQTGVFRGSSTAFYYYQGSYYYLSIDRGQGTLYCAADLESSPQIKTISLSFFYHRFQLEGSSGWAYYPNYSVAWVDGALYYVDQQRRLCRLELSDLSASGLGTVPFTAAGSADGYYDSTHDSICLRYDAQSGDIVAVSKTRPETELGRFQAPDYPPRWDGVSKEQTALAGARWLEDGVLQIGLVYQENGQDVPTLWAAVYDDASRMTDVYQVDTTGLEAGLTVLELQLPAQAAECQVRLFLLGPGCLPCGENISLAGSRAA